LGVPGPWELIIILAIVMLIFGTSKVSGLGKSLGGAIRDFRDSVKTDNAAEEEEATEATEDKPAEDTSKEAGNSNG
jgi:sec-independent protein translocase protein TatA